MGPPLPCPVQLGAYIHVEVAEEEGGALSWKPAKVREVFPSGRFSACVNGEEDFVEEFGAEDEGGEWKRVDDQAETAVAFAAAVDAYEAMEKRLAEEEAAAAAVAAAAAAEAAAAAAAAKAEAKAAKGAAKAPKPKGKVTASGLPPKPPPGMVQPFRWGFGMAVEVKGHDEGVVGSWYPAEVL